MTCTGTGPASPGWPTMPVEPQPTPEEVELAADAIAKVWGYSNLAAADSVQDGDPYAVRKSARAVLAALAEAGRLAPAEARVRTQVAQEIAEAIEDNVRGAMQDRGPWTTFTSKMAYVDGHDKAAKIARSFGAPSGGEKP